MALVRVTAPTALPVSLDEAKFQCRIDGTRSDSGLESLIEDATEHAERSLGRSIMAQAWRVTLDRCFADEIMLPRGPVTAVTTFTYIDTDGAEQTVSPSLYSVDLLSDPQRIVRKVNESWPETDNRVNAVTIDYQAGYVAVPRPVKRAILLLVSAWYDDRKAAIPPQFYELLGNDRDWPA